VEGTGTVGRNRRRLEGSAVIAYKVAETVIFDAFFTRINFGGTP